MCFADRNELYKKVYLNLENITIPELIGFQDLDLIGVFL